MAKRLSTRGIRRNRSYTYEQIAAAVSLSPQTVRKMKLEGLRVMEGSRPHLILGDDFIAFAANRRTERKAPLGPDRLYCLRCKAAVRPYGMMVDYVPMTEARGRLFGLCEHCEGSCNRLVAAAALPQFRAVLLVGGNCGKDA